jgi:hypothetical protein
MLSKAVKLRPNFDDAMAYAALLYKERADYQCDDGPTRSTDLRTADEWIDKVSASKQASVEKTGTAYGLALVSSPPPPPPDLLSLRSANTPPGPPRGGVIGGIHVHMLSEQHCERIRLPPYESARATREFSQVTAEGDLRPTGRQNLRFDTHPIHGPPPRPPRKPGARSGGTVRKVGLRFGETEARCMVIGLVGAGDFRIRGDDAPPVQDLRRGGVSGNGYEHTPTGMHANTKGCALHAEVSR